MSNQKSRRGEKKGPETSECKASAPNLGVRDSESKLSISSGSHPSQTNMEVQVRADSRAAPAWVANAVNV